MDAVIVPTTRHRPKPSPAQLARMRVAVFTRDAWTCQDCGLRMFPQAHDEETGRYAPYVNGIWLELDHITPYSAGGQFVEENLRAACTPCNQKKRASMRYADWPARLARARHLIETRQPSARTAASVIAVLNGEG